MTAEDMFGSINGFDEIAIRQSFGEDVSTLRKTPFRFMRALVFIDQRRKGLRDPDAYGAAMAVTMKEIESYFAEEVPELDPEEPETEQGKDDALSI
jgi:hypothetical protein